MVQIVQVRRVVLTASSLQLMVMPLTRRPRSGEMEHDVPDQSLLIVIVGGIEIGKALRDICLRFRMDTCEATGRSRAADSSRCLHGVAE